MIGSELKKDIWNNESQDRQCAYKSNIAERSKTTVAMEKQLHILSVSVALAIQHDCGLSYPA